MVGFVGLVGVEVGRLGTPCQYAFNPLLIASRWVSDLERPFIDCEILSFVMSDSSRYCRFGVVSIVKRIIHS